MSFPVSKVNDQPRASFYIHLAHPSNHVYRPNSVVDGYIALTSARDDLNIQKFDTPWITLSGGSSTWLCRSVSSVGESSEYINYMDSAELFQVCLALRSREHPVNIGREYRWPFSFRFPEGTGNNRTGCYKNDGDERWTTLPHSLPPSFSFGTKPRAIISGLPRYADISYGLTAGMSGPYDFLTAKETTNFQPSNSYLNQTNPSGVLRFSTQHTLHSSLLKSEEVSSIGFRKRIHDHFSSSAPELSFELALDIPESLSAGAEFRLQALLTVTDKTANVAHIPPVRFRVSGIELLDHTFIRAPADFGPYTKGDLPGWPSSSASHSHQPHFKGQYFQGEKSDSIEGKTPLGCVPQEHTVELEYTVEDSKEQRGISRGGHCETWFSSQIPSSTPPSFKSFAISRRYTMKIRLEAHVAGKKFELKAESQVRYLGGCAPGE